MKVERRDYFLHRVFQSGEIGKSEKFANVLSSFGGEYRTQFSNGELFIWARIGKENYEEFRKELVS